MWVDRETRFDPLASRSQNFSSSRVEISVTISTIAWRRTGRLMLRNAWRRRSPSSGSGHTRQPAGLERSRLTEISEQTRKGGWFLSIALDFPSWRCACGTLRPDAGPSTRSPTLATRLLRGGRASRCTPPRGPAARPPRTSAIRFDADVAGRVRLVRAPVSSARATRLLIPCKKNATIRRPALRLGHRSAPARTGAGRRG